jgi:hypothetical protein
VDWLFGESGAKLAFIVELRGNGKKLENIFDVDASQIQPIGKEVIAAILAASLEVTKREALSAKPPIALDIAPVALDVDPAAPSAGQPPEHANGASDQLAVASPPQPDVPMQPDVPPQAATGEPIPPSAQLLRDAPPPPPPPPAEPVVEPVVDAPPASPYAAEALHGESPYAPKDDDEGEAAEAQSGAAAADMEEEPAAASPDGGIAASSNHKQAGVQEPFPGTQALAAKQAALDAILDKVERDAQDVLSQEEAGLKAEERLASAGLGKEVGDDVQEEDDLEPALVLIAATTTLHADENGNDAFVIVEATDDDVGVRPRLRARVPQAENRWALLRDRLMHVQRRKRWPGIVLILVLVMLFCAVVKRERQVVHHED